MDVGIGLPHLGSLADPDAIRTVAIAAEQAGMTSVWAMDRLLRPLQPRSLGYPGRSDGSLPTAQDVVLDPLVALTVAATVTERVRLGTDVLVAPWYPPVLLARSLAAIDQVSRGRLVAGLGLGWSTDEFAAVGAPITGRGRRMDEVLDVLRAVWTDKVVDVTTTHERIAPSAMGLKPAQAGGPPVLLARDQPKPASTASPAAPTGGCRSGRRWSRSPAAGTTSGAVRPTSVATPTRCASSSAPTCDARPIGSPPGQASSVAADRSETTWPRWTTWGSTR